MSRFSLFVDNGFLLLQEVYKKQVELQRAKSDLFAKQIEQQKTLIRQLDKCKLPAQRKEILKVSFYVLILLHQLSVNAYVLSDDKSSRKKYKTVKR